jgi:periplasmic divalent cation tolerance protein
MKRGKKPTAKPVTKATSTAGALVVVITTVANEVDAQRLAQGLVDCRLAACVQWLPIRSVYRWKGKVEHSPEIQLLIKTPATKKDAVMTWLAENHPYETPEQIVLSVADVSVAYARWAGAETDSDVAS